MRLLVRSVAGLMLVLVLCLCPTMARAQAPAETIEYYGTDAIGSIRIVWDANGTVVGRQDYAPFGRPLFPAAGLPKQGFGAQETDAETDQGYFHARMFQPRAGRFTRSDPVFTGLFQPQRWNRYAYATNNPLVVTDFGGLDPKDPKFRAPGVYKSRSCDSWASCVLQRAYNAGFSDTTEWGGQSGVGSPGGGGGRNAGAGGGRSGRGSGAGGGHGDSSSGDNDGESTGTDDTPIPEFDPDHPIKSVNQCAAALSSRYSLASYFGLRPDNYLGQSVFGNDAATVSNMLTGTNRMSNVGSAAISNPTPANMISGAIYSVGKLGWATNRLDIAVNGAGQAFARGPVVVDLAATTAGSIGSGLLTAWTAGKAIADVGIYVGALYVCASE